MTQAATTHPELRRRPKTPAPPTPPSAGLKGIFALARSGPARLAGLTEMVKRHGEIFFVGVKGRPGGQLIVSDAEAAHRILVANQRNYPKSPMYQMLEPFIGKGLVTSEGELWRRQRRLAQPAFHKPQIAAMASTMTGVAEETADRWQGFADRGETVDVAAQMARLTLAIAARTLFGADLAGGLDTFGTDLTEVLRWADKQTTSLVSLPRTWPTPGNLRFRRALARLDATVWRIIDARRAAPEPGTDLLGMLLSARDADTGEGMDDQQLRDEVMTLLLAGHETTANTLAWTFLLLGKNPEAAARLHAELDTVLAGRTPSLEDLSRLGYTTRVIDEALRLYPPAWAVGRRAADDDTLCGYEVAKGTDITLSIYSIHRSPEYWENPDAFDPDRFLPERSEGRPRLAFLPFGAGPRQCMGNHFALAEAPLVLATLAQRFEVKVAEGHRVAIDPTLTLRPLGGVPATLTSRGQRPERRVA